MDRAILAHANVRDTRAVTGRQIGGDPVVVDFVVIGTTRDRHTARTGRHVREQGIADRGVVDDLVVVDAHAILKAIRHRRIRLLVNRPYGDGWAQRRRG